MDEQRGDPQQLVKWWSKLVLRTLCDEAANRNDVQMEEDDGNNQCHTSGPQGSRLCAAIDDGTGDEQHRVDAASA